MLSPSALVQPLFLAVSSASQIVINDHDSHSEACLDQDGHEPLGKTAVVNPSALKLVNSFLDQLLFNFLAISKSTSLASLRPAVVETLKPKLAKEAIHLADKELEEYLGSGYDEELTSFHDGIEPSEDWNLELVWKRTRLRCMVYSSLGDMEEEDEDRYIELEHLHPTNVLSPAAAIFLTSIIEFMGEQALTVAGRAAYHRMRSKQQSSVPENVADRVVVKDVDMERVALDRTLGRLWRGWKKRLRSPNASNPHSVGAATNYNRHSRASQEGGDKTDPIEFAEKSQIMAPSRVPIGGVLTLGKGRAQSPSSDILLRPLTIRGANVSVSTASRGASLIQKTPSGSLTVKASYPLASQVIKPETVALRIDPVPVRSPLREAQRTKLTSEALSVQDTQFAVTPPGSSPKSSQLVPTWTNQMDSAGSETSFARPLTPLRKIIKNVSATSDEASTIASRYSDASVFQSELHPALRSAPPPESAARVRPKAHRLSAPYVPIVVAKSLAGTGTYNRLQARDAVAKSDNLSSAQLTDFIRQGPPSSLGGPSAFDQEDIMSKRKIHSVKDPYAVDYGNDEEDDDEYALPKGPPERAGMSLIDFLNSVPPPDTSMNSIFNELSAILPKKTVMARFSRSKSATSSSLLTRRSVLARSSSLLHNASASLTRHSPISAGQLTWMLPSSPGLRS